VLSHAPTEVLALVSHFLCQLEHALLLTAVSSIAMRGRLAFLLGDILVAFFQLLDFHCKAFNVLVLLADEFLELDELLFL
jgi:hypothetical protein